MKDKVFVILPAYNEDKRILTAIKQCKKYVDNVIVVDDGSTDNTFNQAQKSGAITLKHIVNMGKGVAMKTGTEYAIQKGADIIVVIDADGQHNPSEIPRLIKLLKQKKVGIVLGMRQMPPDSPVIFRLGNWGLNQIFRIMFGSKIEDTQNGFRVFNAKVYPKLKWKSQRYFVETEMIINMLKNKVSHVETPVQTFYHDHYKGTTVLIGLEYFIKMLEVKIGWV
ncbi:glycosyltransferase family 2 protein [Candidatus Woesearchaeota archaeon]|jgi:glycosyltransferase involved in cell wall biosynthesis|nr:glycosyltransferase family 2 protein [Candidatus Woesearchaeota archaeon]MBT4114171.1 glycosyltransferase family 2 protein [Candidatus Woesearchaeota archaeon]MBT4248386.1 glycosyltransferase family 2 protein [Candidatus Woesearchaeota archaeon]